MEGLSNSRLRSWTVLVVSLVLLDASVTFSNVWPTPAVRWHGAISVELAVCVLALLAASRRGAQPRPLLAAASILWVFLIAGRYADVTVPALYGHEVNLYWDLRHVPAVIAMLARVASPAVILLAVGVIVLVPLALYATARFAFSARGTSTITPRERRVLGLLAGLAVVWFAAQHLDARFPQRPAFPAPVTAT